MMARNERDFGSGASEVSYRSIRHMTGQRDREREERHTIESGNIFVGYIYFQSAAL